MEPRDASAFSMLVGLDAPIHAFHYPAHCSHCIFNGLDSTGLPEKVLFSPLHNFNFVLVTFFMSVVLCIHFSTRGRGYSPSAVAPDAFATDVGTSSSKSKNWLAAKIPCRFRHIRRHLDTTRSMIPPTNVASTLQHTLATTLRTHSEPRHTLRCATTLAFCSSLENSVRGTYSMNT